MRIKPILRALGLLLIGEAALMLPSLGVSFWYGGEDAPAFLIAIAVLLIAGLPPALLIRGRMRTLYAREGFIFVGAAWMLISVFGAVPLMLFTDASVSPIDAIFESVSGFTTTGASILADVEALPRGLLFWRGFSHWIGGMGVLVLTAALLPQLGIHGMDILKAESTGPAPGKLLPRIRDMAKVLYGLYLGLSLLMLTALGITGMPLFDALVTVFSTAGTGGLAAHSGSIAAYGNPAAEIIIAVFMLLFSVNFALFYALLMRQFRKAFLNRELLTMLAVAACSVMIILPGIRPLYATGAEALRHSFFQVTSLMSTTGFTSTDFSTWPGYTQVLLMCLMVIGGCAGSTSGGIKMIRLILAGKAFRRELHLVMHPQIVKTATLEGKPVTDATMRSVYAYFFAYISLAAVATFIISFDGFSLGTTFTAVLTMISNAGPALVPGGLAKSYAAFSDLSKIIMSLCMLIGRLEIMPILLLFMPSTWKKL